MLLQLTQTLPNGGSREIAVNSDRIEYIMPEGISDGSTIRTSQGGNLNVSEPISIIEDILAGRLQSDPVSTPPPSAEAFLDFASSYLDSSGATKTFTMKDLRVAYAEMIEDEPKRADDDPPPHEYVAEFVEHLANRARLSGGNRYPTVIIERIRKDFEEYIGTGLGS